MHIVKAKTGYSSKRSKAIPSEWITTSYINVLLARNIRFAYCAFLCLICLTFTTTTVQVIAMIQNIPIARAISSCLSWMVVFEQSKDRTGFFWKFYESLLLLLLATYMKSYLCYFFETFTKSYFCCFSFSAFFSSSISLIVFPLSSSSSLSWEEKVYLCSPHCPERRESVFICLFVYLFLYICICVFVYLIVFPSASSSSLSWEEKVYLRSAQLNFLHL